MWFICSKVFTEVTAPSQAATSEKVKNIFPLRELCPPNLPGLRLLNFGLLNLVSFSFPTGHFFISKSLPSDVLAGELGEPFHFFPFDWPQAQCLFWDTILIEWIWNSHKVSFSQFLYAEELLCGLAVISKLTSALQSVIRRTLLFWTLDH